MKRYKLNADHGNVEFKDKTRKKFGTSMTDPRFYTPMSEAVTNMQLASSGSTGTPYYDFSSAEEEAKHKDMPIPVLRLKGLDPAEIAMYQKELERDVVKALKKYKDDADKEAEKMKKLAEEQKIQKDREFAAKVSAVVNNKPQ